MKLFGTAKFLYYLQATSSVPFFTLVEILGDEFELETFHFGSNCSKLKKTLQQLCPCSFSDAVCDNFKCYFALEQLLEEILIYKPFLKKASICKERAALDPCQTSSMELFMKVIFTIVIVNSWI